MWALIKKEVWSHLTSPFLAVTASLFLFLSGFAFTAHVTRVTPQNLPEASMRGLLYFMAVVLLFITPIFTMKIFAEERKTGTMELLKTAPLSNLQIVLGKFLSLWLLMTMVLLLTVEFPIFLFIGGSPDLGPVLLAYLGLFLFTGAAIASGLFFSLLTRSQMIAALSTFVFLLTLWFLAEVGWKIGEAVSLATHLEGFSLGVLNLTDLLYFLLFPFLFLFLSVRFLEAERWK